MIRLDIWLAVVRWKIRTYLDSHGNRTGKGFDGIVEQTAPIEIMRTSPRWSALP